MDIYLLEAIINGILLGGVLALLALGLNLIFGVIDVSGWAGRCCWRAQWPSPAWPCSAFWCMS
jgi:hypothetical protein